MSLPVQGQSKKESNKSEKALPVSIVNHSNELSDTSKRVKLKDLKSKNGQNQPLYILDGKTITAEEFAALDVNLIESVHVLKDASAIEKYGDKGKHGVIEITLKK
jgi:bla regulator protein BlaR1